LSDLIPVSELGVGQRMCLRRVVGGQRLQRRLLALGLNLGGEIEVVQRRGGGVVVARDGNRVALGVGVAHKLLGERVA